MKKHLIKKMISIAVVLLLGSSITLQGLKVSASGEQAYDETLTLKEDGTIILEQAESYQNYLEEHRDAVYPETEVTIGADSVSGSSTEVEMQENYQGKAGRTVLTPADGYTEWSFEVKTAGFYHIALDYFPMEGKGATIVRSLRIDGELPFNEARTLNFYRNWQDQMQDNGNRMKQDKQGNDIRPEQVEAPIWMSAYLRDTTGFYNTPLQFYFSAGPHTIRLTATQEPMAVHTIRLCQQKTPIKYQQPQAQGGTALKTVQVEGENTKAKSDPMIVPVSDKSSPATSPSSSSLLKLNCIGGGNWQQSGQWIEWEFEVETTGLYQISMRTLQNASSGAASYRRISLDGEVACQELSDYGFPYHSSFQMSTLHIGENPILFQLEQGQKHTLRMEVTLGPLAQLLYQAQDITNELNTIYREILMITGATPDVNRDYQFKLTIPETLENLKEQEQRLKKLEQELIQLTGKKSQGTAILERLYFQIDEMLEKPDRIAKNFNGFQNNISTLGSWITDGKQQPLTIDYILVSPAGAEVPDGKAGFFDTLSYHVMSFVNSFFVDYNVISDDSGENVVSVWVGNGLTGGRDQAQILKTLADNNFTPESGITVNLQLVSMGALLPATLSGKGPDVALTIGSGDIANYAFRNAAVNLRGFSDFNEIAQRFSASALTPLSFDGKTYGLPETQTFPMLFYRKDILTEIGVKVPRTWDDVINLLPVLNKKQLNFGLPTVTGTTSGLTMPMYAMLLMQNGGAFYTEDAKKTTIESAASIEAFSFYTSLYTDYQIPQTIDFINRFRIGSIPIGIADYSVYNQLSVFAPEIDGLWGFTRVPGTLQEDGSIDAASPGGVMASLLLKNTADKEAGWEFLKWWTSAETQIMFGKQLESIMGTAARYPTANLEALEQIPWSTENYKELMLQWNEVKGVPEVPGGYYTPRYIDFAFRDAVNKLLDPAESITNSAKMINDEIYKKRKEFGLPN